MPQQGKRQQGADTQRSPGMKIFVSFATGRKTNQPEKKWVGSGGD